MTDCKPALAPNSRYSTEGILALLWRRTADDLVLFNLNHYCAMAKAVRVAAASGNAALESAPPTRTLTAFEQRLHAVCKAIPQGKVTTYGAMAKVLESSPRAVGQVWWAGGA